MHRYFEDFTEMFSGLDANAQVERYGELLESANSAKVRREILKWSGFVSIAVFAKAHLPEMVRLPFGKHHTEFFNAIPRGARGMRVNIVAPRGSAKSTTIAVILPLHAIYYKKLYESLDMTPDNFIVILSRSRDNAADRVKDIRSLIETTPSLKHLQGEDPWGSYRAETRNGILLIPQSRGGKVRGLLYKGYRPSLVLPDDMEDIEALRNPDRVRDDEDWWSSDLMQCGDASTNFINVDTVKAEHAIAQQLQKSPSWHNIIIKAIDVPSDLIHPTSEPLWERYREIYTDLSLSPLERGAQLDAFYDAHKDALTEGVRETWSEKWTWRQIKEKTFDDGRSTILREYQNAPMDMQLAIFDMENAISFEIASGHIDRTDDYMSPAITALSGATVFLDYSGVKDSIDNCFAAVVVILWQPVAPSRYADGNDADCYGYCWKVWLDRGSRELQMTNLLKLYQETDAFFKMAGMTDRSIRVFTEAPVDTLGDIRENFLRHYYTLAEKMQVEAPLEFLPRHREKVERIAGLEAPIKNGWLAFATNLDEEFLLQLRQFPTSQYLDGPDALQGAWEVKIRETVETRQKQRQRNNARAEASKVLDW